MKIIYCFFFILVSIPTIAQKKHVVEKYSNGNIYEEYDMIVTDTKQMRVSTTNIFDQTLGNFQVESGVIDGEFKRYYLNGQVELVCEFKKNIHDGAFKMYFENGTLYKDMEYTDGEISAMSKVYYTDGTLKETFEPNGETIDYKLWDGAETPSIIGEGVLGAKNRFASFMWHMKSNSGKAWTVSYIGLRTGNYSDFEYSCTKGTQYEFFESRYSDGFEMIMSDSSSYAILNQDELKLYRRGISCTIPLIDGECVVEKFAVYDNNNKLRDIYTTGKIKWLKYGEYSKYNYSYSTVAENIEATGLGHIETICMSQEYPAVQLEIFETWGSIYVYEESGRGRSLDTYTVYKGEDVFYELMPWYFEGPRLSYDGQILQVNWINSDFFKTLKEEVPENKINAISGLNLDSFSEIHVKVLREIISNQYSTLLGSSRVLVRKKLVNPAMKLWDSFSEGKNYEGIQRLYNRLQFLHSKDTKDLEKALKTTDDLAEIERLLFDYKN